MIRMKIFCHEQTCFGCHKFTGTYCQINCSLQIDKIKSHFFHVIVTLMQFLRGKFLDWMFARVGRSVAILPVASHHSKDCL